MIDIKGLNCSINGNNILHGIDLNIGSGEVVGVIGKNGAGKTTLIEIMEGINKNYSGQMNTQFEAQGVQLQESSLPKFLKTKDVILFFAKLKNIEIDWDGIFVTKDVLNKKVKSLSTGQYRKLILSIAVLGNPDIIFLDEPTAGLDLETKFELYEVIANIVESKKTVIFASHDMEEVNRFAQRVLIIKDGRLVRDLDRDTLNRLSNIYKVRNSEFNKENTLLNFSFNNIEYIEHSLITDKYDIHELEKCSLEEVVSVLLEVL